MSPTIANNGFQEINIGGELVILSMYWLGSHSHSWNECRL